MKRRNLFLLLFVLIASVALIGINYYTIKVLSGMRAYINGESEYSKGQKDASLDLSAYIQTKDPVYWADFSKAISVPVGDNIARKSLLADMADSVAERGFLSGRNAPDDVGHLIWLFKTFRSVSFMKEAVRLWADAEPLVNELNGIGNEVHSEIVRGKLLKETEVNAVRNVSLISARLSQKERAFSQLLGNSSRKFNMWLLLFNVICVGLILGSIGWYALTMITRLSRSQQTLKASNLELSEINRELDTFVFSASHDLRSPIASLKGLIEIMKVENDAANQVKYLAIMDNLVDKQDLFIKEIIDFFRNKRASITCKEISLSALIDEVISNNKFMPQARDIVITREIAVDQIYGDELRLKIILNNLVSNAIKYSDESKPVRLLKVKTGQQKEQVHIEVEDNGIGIATEYFDRIFDIFFVAPENTRGTGLGLYILKQNVDKLKGTVKVQSEVTSGSKFTICLPKQGVPFMAIA